MLLSLICLFSAGIFSTCYPYLTHVPPATDIVAPGYVDSLTVKYDVNGKQVWEKLYVPARNGTNHPVALNLDTSDNIYVSCGTSNVDYTTHAYQGGCTTVKYDNNGAQLWIASSLIDVPTPSGIAATVDRFGNLYTTGSFPGNDGKAEIVTFKHNSDGQLVWETRHRNPWVRYQEPTSITLDNAGNLYIAGYLRIDDDNYDYLTLKYDNQGSLVWAVTWDGPAHSKDIPYKLAVNDKGSVYVTGESLQKAPGENFDFVTIKYDSDGKELWVSQYKGRGYDSPTDLKLDSEGNVVITGRSRSLYRNLDWEYVTVKYDSNGRQLWVNRYHTPGIAGSGSYGSAAYALDIDNEGNIYVTGESWNDYYNSDYTTIKYDTNGKQVWIARYNGTASGKYRASALFVDSDYEVYVTGVSDNSFDTVKYDKQGKELWVAKYGVAFALDAPISVKVDKQGNVFIVAPVRHW